MSDTNVTSGMVPCKPNCRCLDCQLERKEAKNRELRAENERLWHESNAANQLLREIKNDLTRRAWGVSSVQLDATIWRKLSDFLVPPDDEALDLV